MMLLSLSQLSARLSERRIAVEKEVLKYGEAPAGIKEVFELCRGFERAYTSYVNVSKTAVPCTREEAAADLQQRGPEAVVLMAPAPRSPCSTAGVTCCQQNQGGLHGREGAGWERKEAGAGEGVRAAQRQGGEHRGDDDDQALTLHMCATPCTPEPHSTAQHAG